MEVYMERKREVWVLMWEGKPIAYEESGRGYVLVARGIGKRAEQYVRERIGRRKTYGKPQKLLTKLWEREKNKE
jgi:hypothetical protein